MIETEAGIFRILDDFDLEGKRVLVRVDFNSPLVEGKVRMNDRIMEHAKTLKELSDKGAIVVAIAHQGRPGEADYLENMEQHARLASKIVKTDYVNDLAGEEALEKIKNLEKGQVLLLKNVRSLEDEFRPSPDNILVKKLAPFFDLFVSDAFSVVHRDQASVTGFSSLPSCVGRVMERELMAVKDLRSRKMVYILGGAKPEDNLVLAKDPKVEKVLSTGIFSLLCLAAKGCSLGKQDESLDRNLVEEAKKVTAKTEVPVDVAINDNGRKEIGTEELPVDKDILDIGQRTVEKYAQAIAGAGAVFMKGPAGKFEQKGFEKGTLGLLEAIASSDCFSLIAGGHSSHVIESFSLSKDKFSHVSLAGGALIAYLAGKKLPGLEALKFR